MNNITAVKEIPECFIKPKYEVEGSKHPYYLAPYLTVLSICCYSQKGLLFAKPSNLDDQESTIKDLLESLKDSLSLTLVHFYPLAGQLATEVDEDRHECLIYVDCNKGPGARFIHAYLQMSMSDILLQTHVPLVIQSLFDHNGAINYDGHTRPLLSVQVTELLDGIFIGCSMNHVMADGTSFWHFCNMWSEIHKANGKYLSISRPPAHERWSRDQDGSCIRLPFTHPDEFIRRYEEAPELRERIFHLSSESIARLKAKANEECATKKISSFQAMTALVWRSIVRASRRSYDQATICGILANNRHRLHPPLPEGYFGNSCDDIKATTTVGRLIENSLGRVALLVHQYVTDHSDKGLRDNLKEWLQSFEQHTVSFPYGVSMTKRLTYTAMNLDLGNRWESVPVMPTSIQGM